MRNVIDRLSGIAVFRSTTPRWMHDRALYGINCTGELNKRPIAHQLDHAAAIFGDGGIDQCGAQFFQRFQRASLVFGH